ncbi:hypothetical protein Vi05172_g11597 [Venturia inaequalis]|nr:hypothetical protein Vi05172_g11597 [Venturia inaequalis]
MPMEYTRDAYVLHPGSSPRIAADTELAMHSRHLGTHGSPIPMPQPSTRLDDAQEPKFDVQF